MKVSVCFRPRLEKVYLQFQTTSTIANSLLQTKTIRPFPFPILALPTNIEMREIKVCVCVREREREREELACHIQVEALSVKREIWRRQNLVPPLSALFFSSV